MDRYEEAFYAEERKKERERLKDNTVTSAIEFVIWVDQFSPDDDEMATVVHTLPDTEQQRLKNAVAKIKAMKGNQDND
jgi:hypothetical protein